MSNTEARLTRGTCDSDDIHVLSDYSISNPDFKPPLLSGESIHLGYTAITEQEAFENPTTNIRWFPSSSILIPRGQYSIDTIIDRIRKVILCSDAVDVVVPKCKFVPIPFEKSLYKTTLHYSYVGKNGHLCIKLCVELYAVSQKAEDGSTIESIAVIFERLAGFHEPFLAFYHTVRNYILSDGNTSCVTSIALWNSDESMSTDYTVGYAGFNSLREYCDMDPDEIAVAKTTIH